MRVEFRLSGSGGQGLLLAGIVLADAAIQDGKNAVQTQSYGPEARGGSSKAEVVISDGDIDYPKATEPDFLLALTLDAFRTYGPLMKKGIIITDTSVAADLPSAGTRLEALTAGVPVITLPILETASKKLGRAVVANMVALGVLGAFLASLHQRPCARRSAAAFPKEPRTSTWRPWKPASRSLKKRKPSWPRPGSDPAPDLRGTRLEALRRGHDRP
jgi:Pyruvate:ferredoxin oxidoreductase and related 2-oxoacid:ferredoxin oxidoreductases, gamma subunit